MITDTIQSRTIVRAQEQAGNYTFKRMTVRTSRGPVSIVYVYGGSETYQITEGPHHPRCSCPAYKRWHAGTLNGRCKHLVALQMSEQAREDAACRARLEQRAAEVQRAGEQARRMRLDWQEVD